MPETETTTMTNLVKYTETEKRLSELRELYRDVPDCTTKEGYEVARCALSELVSLRTGLEKHRTYLKRDALEYGKKVDAEAKRVKEEIEAIELPIREAKKAIDDAKEAEREAKKQAELKRVTDIRAKINHIREVPAKVFAMTTFELSEKIKAMESYEITLPAYHEFTEEANEAMTETLAVLRQALAEKVNAEKVAKEQEVERLRLKEEAEKLEKIRAEQQAELDRQREEAEKKQAEIDAENKRKSDALEEENRKRQAEMDRQKKEMEERQAILDKAESDRQTEIERVQREKEESERKEAGRLALERMHQRSHEEYAAHCNESIAGIVACGVCEDAAKAILDAIRNDEIPHVTFNG